MAESRRRVPTKRSEVFVERFDLVRAAGTTKLRARVYQPVRMPTGEYGCTYEIRTGRKAVDKPRRLYGEDGVQALTLVLGMIDLDLDFIIERTGGKIAPWQRRDLRRLRLGTAGKRRG